MTVPDCKIDLDISKQFAQCFVKTNAKYFVFYWLGITVHSSQATILAFSGGPFPTLVHSSSPRLFTIFRVYGLGLVMRCISYFLSSKLMLPRFCWRTKDNSFRCPMWPGFNFSMVSDPAAPESDRKFKICQLNEYRSFTKSVRTFEIPYSYSFSAVHCE